MAFYDEDLVFFMSFLSMFCINYFIVFFIKLILFAPLNERKNFKIFYHFIF